MIGDGPVDVTLWEDFQCPICKSSKRPTATCCKQRVDDGDITLTIHPLSFLDAKLGNDSSVLGGERLWMCVATPAAAGSRLSPDGVRQPASGESWYMRPGRPSS